MLLTVAGAFRPFYLALLLPAALAAWGESRRRAALAGLLAGALLLLAVTALGQWTAGASWTGYGGERGGFLSAHRLSGGRLSGERLAAGDQSLGRTPPGCTKEGLDPAYNPAAAGLERPLLPGRPQRRRRCRTSSRCSSASWPSGRTAGGGRSCWRWGWRCSASSSSGRSTSTAAGERSRAATSCRSIRPSGSWWAGRCRVRWAIPVVLLAAPFLYLLWRHPTAFPVGEDGRYRHVTPVAQRLLPYETTQSHIPGGQDFADERRLAQAAAATTSTGSATGRPRLRGLVGGAEEILVGSPEPLEGAASSASARQAPSHAGARRPESCGPPSCTRTAGSPSRFRLQHARAVHPCGGPRTITICCELDLRLPGAPAAPIGVGYPSGAGS